VFAPTLFVLAQASVSAAPVAVIVAATSSHLSSGGFSECLILASSLTLMTSARA
jgi:hypothetical protein